MLCLLCGWHVDLELTSIIPAEFDVGQGASCINISVQILSFDSDQSSEQARRVEQRCVLPGHHEYNHTVEDTHTVEVIGYVNSSLQHGAGGITPFVVGECTDSIFRITTVSAAHEVEWIVDDNGHNGPWRFSSPPSVGTYEYKSCMFDNRFTVDIENNAEASWVGTVEVLTKMPFENTIIIPNDESWIIQGIEGVETPGIPIELAARFESGRTFYEHGCHMHDSPDGVVNQSAYPECTAGSISRASLVVRHARFTNRSAPLDRFRSHYTFSVVAGTSLGAVLRYTGGWGAQLVFQHCVFDHLWATTGATFVVDGQMDEYARDPFIDTVSGPESVRLTVEISECLFWELNSPWLGNRFVDIYPSNLTVVNNQFIDNYALVSSAINFGLYGGTFPEGHGVLGSSYHTYVHNEVACQNPIGGVHEGSFEMAPFTEYAYPTHWEVGPGTVRPDVSTFIVYDHMVCHDYHVSAIPCYLTFNRGNYNGGNFKVRVVDTEIRDTSGSHKVEKYSGAPMYFEMDNLEVARTTVIRSEFNTTRDPEETNVAEGTISVWATESAAFINTSILDSGHHSRGGALGLSGPGSFKIANCLFQGNIAISDGGAVFFSSSGSLFVQDSVFINNLVERQVVTSQQIIVSVFTGATGAGETLRPLWKIDGNAPDLDTGHCGNETVYGNATYDQAYLSGALYSEVLRVTSGEHTLWHGVEAYTSAGFSSWTGGGWISIMGILTKVFPKVCDNRPSPHCPPPNNFARAPGCYHGDSGSGLDSQLEFCPHAQAFWSSTHFTVPSGTGGAVAAAGTGPIAIYGSTFTNNQAGFGDALAATGSQSLLVRDTDFDPATLNTFSLEGVLPTECRDSPCPQGQSCRFEQLSLRCDPCPPGEIGVDGLHCEMCEPGKQPNTNQTVCTQCVYGTFSSSTTSGICETCDPGSTSADDRETCIDCPAGQAGFNATCTSCPLGSFSFTGQPVCTECPPGKTSNAERSGCIVCGAGKARPLGQDDCTDCTPGTAPDANGQLCLHCSEPGYYAQPGQAVCEACKPGTQPFANRTGCTDCPAGTAGLDGMCIPCQTGRYAEAGQVSCMLCQQGMEPTDDKSTCRCNVGTYNSDIIGVVRCDGSLTPPGGGGQCAECPDCLDCTKRGVVELKEGWASFGHTTTVYTCPFAPACPKRVLNATWLDEQSCADGHDPASPLCAMCSDNFNAYKVSKQHTACIIDDFVLTRWFCLTTGRSGMRPLRRCHDQHSTVVWALSSCANSSRTSGQRDL